MAKKTIGSQYKRSKKEKSLFARNLKLMRVSNLETQEVLATAIGPGIAASNVGSFEHGVEPKYSLLVKIAEHYNVTIDDLLTKEYTIGQKKGKA